jgi:hypothetical protein
VPLAPARLLERCSGGLRRPAHCQLMIVSEFPLRSWLARESEICAAFRGMAQACIPIFSFPARLRIHAAQTSCKRNVTLPLIAQWPAIHHKDTQGSAEKESSPPQRLPEIYGRTIDAAPAGYAYPRTETPENESTARPRTGCPKKRAGSKRLKSSRFSTSERVTASVGPETMRKSYTSPSPLT